MKVIVECTMQEWLAKGASLCKEVGVDYVKITDAQPDDDSPGTYIWMKKPTWMIPAEIFSRMKGQDLLDHDDYLCYTRLDESFDALSEACLSLARAQIILE